MEHQFLGRSGLVVSNICLGGMTFGTSEGMNGFFKNPDQTSEEDSIKILERYSQLGGNFIDTADIYALGTSEKIIGNWLARKKRDKFVIATKCRLKMDETNPNSGGLGRRHITESIDRSLERLKTYFIDLYQMHMWDAATPIEETLRTFHDLVRCDKVRYIGCSNLVGWQLQKVMDYSKFMGLTPMISLQQQYNLLCRHSELEEFHITTVRVMALISTRIDDYSDRSFSSDTDSGDDDDSQSSMETLASDISNVHEDQFWTDQLHDIDIGQFEETVGPIHQLAPNSPVLQGLLTGKFIKGEPPDPQTRVGFLFKKFPALSTWQKDSKNEKYWILVEKLRDIAKRHGKTVPQVALRWLLQKDFVASVVIGVRSIKQLEDNAGASELDIASATEIPYPYELNYGPSNASRYNPFNK
ncbi:hypothetical protein KUTeg_011783 [Tegillarca granosa]|uniref:NADP-dependent oxidoreductase domain-containing protein n=1 Tax=Tegillarca granosa TaxID=220873 RepID=A0ABQ9EXP1_TEGGR|nr:hypothetical protein KUTeg_011783 [Tegillarca granosa]